MADNVKITGIDDAVNQINRRIKAIQVNNPKALREIGLDLVGKAKKRAPLDKGDLRGSGFSKLEGDTVTVGFTEPYALRQHEHTEYNHPLGGEAKFLERPLNENIKKYIKHLEDSTKKAVE